MCESELKISDLCSSELSYPTFDKKHFPSLKVRDLSPILRTMYEKTFYELGLHLWDLGVVKVKALSS